MIEYTKFEDVEPSAVRLTVGVSSESTGKTYNQVLDKFRKKAHISGFRPGKAPRDVIMRKFGDGIRYESAMKLVDKAIQEVLPKAERQPYSQPKIDDLPEISPDKPYEFVLHYDIYPTFTVGEYKNTEIEAYDVDILDEHTDKELELQRNRFAVVIEKENGIVSENDIVSMDFVELDKDSKPIEATRRLDFVMSENNAHPYNIETEIAGMKNGETKRILSKRGSADKNNESDSPETPEVYLDVTIKSIKERQMPDLDNEFAQDVSEDHKTLEDLKKKIRADIEKNAQEKIRVLKYDTVMKKMLENADIILPESMIQSDLQEVWNNYVQRSGVAEKTLIKALEENERNKESIMEGWREDSIKSVKTRVICSQIVEKEKIEVSNEELEKDIQSRAENYKMTVEEFEKRFGDNQIRGYLKGQLVNQKLIDLLSESAVVSKVEKLKYDKLMSL